jgi:hypothetical protein
MLLHLVVYSRHRYYTLASADKLPTNSSVLFVHMASSEPRLDWIKQVLSDTKEVGKRSSGFKVAWHDMVPADDVRRAKLKAAADSHRELFDYRGTDA